MNINVTSTSVIAVAAVGFLVAVLLSAQAPPSRSVWDGVYTEGQAGRGQSLYDAHCALCHGEGLEGVEISPPLVGSEFLSTWDGQMLGAFFQKTRTTMPLGEPGSLTSAENADLTAYVLWVNKFPPGKIELPRQTAVLNQILIETTKRD